MLNPIRSKRVIVAAASLFLAGALAVSAADVQERHLARVKKQPDGTVPLKQVAGYTGYDSDKEYHAKIKNLTDPLAIAALKAKHFQLVVGPELNGGILNGTIEIGDSVVQFDVTGGGTLEGFHHVFTMPAKFEVHSAPHKPGADIDTFETNMYRIEGSGSDDVFASLRLVGGTGNGYPSPGQMTLISKGDEVVVDSFFNVGFRLEFTGAKGGPFEGVSDAVEGNVTMRSYADPNAPLAAKPRPAREPRTSPGQKQ